MEERTGDNSMAKKTVQNKRRAQKNNLYVYGNTVRKLETAPEINPNQPERRVTRNAVRKNREKAKHMNPAYVLFLSAATIVTVAVCFQYVQLRSEITGRIENIAALEAELSDLKIENDAEYSRITNSVSLEEIKQIAMEELGMVYANEDQVVLYEDKEAEYFRQYEDIPEE